MTFPLMLGVGQFCISQRSASIRLPCVCCFPPTSMSSSPLLPECTFCPLWFCRKWEMSWGRWRGLQHLLWVCSERRDPDWRRSGAGNVLGQKRCEFEVKEDEKGNLLHRTLWDVGVLLWCDLRARVYYLYTSPSFLYLSVPSSLHPSLCPSLHPSTPPSFHMHPE